MGTDRCIIRRNLNRQKVYRSVSVKGNFSEMQFFSEQPTPAYLSLVGRHHPDIDPFRPPT